MGRRAMRGDAGGSGPTLERRELLRGTGAAGAAAGLTTLVLPSARAAASTSFDIAAYETYTIGFTQAATGSSSNPAYGFRLEPDQQAPSGTGVRPGSGDVRLVQLDVLFVGGSGSKAVTGTAVDLAVYPTTTKRSGAALVEEALGGVIATWSGAEVVAASGADTWLRFTFTTGTVLLDVATTYYVGTIAGGSAFQSAMSVRTAPQTSGAWSSAIDSAGTAFSYRVVMTGTFAY